AAKIDVAQTHSSQVGLPNGQVGEVRPAQVTVELAQQMQGIPPCIAWHPWAAFTQGREHGPHLFLNALFPPGEEQAFRQWLKNETQLAVPHLVFSLSFNEGVTEKYIH